ncbi:GntR family transcriptional regulator [Palleronia caenipelagi]|nr:GntR family transcriptional regulator [Palleronia caenipelagi]
MQRYVQIASALRARIDAAEFDTGTSLPSIQLLSRAYEAAPETVRQALAHLEQEGIVARRQGVGTIVLAKSRDLRWLRLPSDWDGLVTFFDALEVQRLVTESADRMPELHPEEGQALSAYKYLRRVHSRAGEPFCVIGIHLSAEIYIRRPREFREKVVVPILAQMDDVEIGTVRQTLRFDVADPEMAKLLDVPIAAPVVVVRRTICDPAGQVIYLADVTYRGDVVRLEMDLSPP